MSENYETITIELDKEKYENLLELVKENKTTIDDIINNFLKLCVKENGLVIWNNGFDQPYKVLKTKEDVQKWLKENNEL